MDTQTLQVTETTDLATEVSKARAQLERLRGAAADAQAEADRWQTTFEREPTPQAHTSAAVAKQKAANAKAAAERFELETLAPLIAKQQSQADDAERAVLAKRFDWAKAEALIERIEEGASEFQRTLRSASDELAAFLLERLDSSQKASALGLAMPPQSFARLVMEMNERIGYAAKDRYGNPLTLLTFTDQGTHQQLHVEVNAHLQVNRRVL